MLAVVDYRIPSKLSEGLIRQGFDLLTLPSHPSLSVPVSAHPDMLLFFAKDGILTTREYAAVAPRELSILSAHTQKEIVLVDEATAPLYPRDILLNAAVVGDRVFCRSSHTTSKITQSPAYTVCPVRQGYAKCSTVPVGRNALITADHSIAEAARKAATDVLLIEPTHIDIMKYDTGFIGGATSYAPYQDLECIYFCGEWELHPQADQIYEFLKKHCKKPISLAKGSLTDIGTVFLI